MTVFAKPPKVLADKETCLRHGGRMTDTECREANYWRDYRGRYQIEEGRFWMDLAPKLVRRGW